MAISRKAFQFASLFLLLLGIGWIYLSRQPITSASADPMTAAQKGFLAPDFTAQTLGGETVRLSSLKGKPVILNLWASWCPPCREETPALQRVSEDYAAKGLIVLGVNMTTQDSQQAAVDFSQEYQLTYPILLDPDGAISRLYRVQALPTTYFIDADGLIRDVIVGGPVAEAAFRAQSDALFIGAH